VRILVVHNRYQRPGGEDVVFDAEAALLRAHGHQVSQYVEDNAEIGYLNRPRVAVDTIWSRRAGRRLRSLMAEHTPDLVHFHNTFPLISPAAYVTCRRAGLPVVQTLHNYRLICPNALLFRDGHPCEECVPRAGAAWPGVLHACYRSSRPQTAVVAAMLAVHRLRRTWSQDVTIYIALTNFAREKFIAGGLPAAKIAVKPNFVAPDPGVVPAEKGCFLFVGRLSEEKGIRTLLRTWARGNVRVPLRIVGAGPLEGVVREAADGSEFISYLGPLERAAVFQHMRSAHALVFPSEWYEALPVTILEAFACGLPVIAADRGAAGEIVRHAHTGLLFTPGDDHALEAQLSWAGRHPDELRAMSLAARQEYEAKYTAAANYGQLLQIYRRAIAQGSPRPPAAASGGPGGPVEPRAETGTETA
jgi:glycosyltransferase involved in cell wall biosynthesis